MRDRSGRSRAHLTMPTAAAHAAESVPDFDLGPLSWVQAETGLALTRGLDLLAAFRATPTDPALLRQARNQIHQAVGAIQMVGLDAAIAYTDELERQLGAARADAGRGRRADVRHDRSRLPEARDLPRRSGDRCSAGAAQALSRIRGDATVARGQGRRRDRSVLPGNAAAHAASGCAAARRAEETGGASRQAAPRLSERPARVPARRRRRRKEDARGRGGTGAGEHAGIRACFLVDRRRVLRGPGRRRARTRLRRETARRAARPADSPRRGGFAQGRDEVAARGALLRRRELAGDADGRGGAERIRPRGSHPLGRGAQCGSDPPAADPARGPRGARHREEHLAAGHARPGRKPAEAPRNSAGRARQCRRHRQSGPHRAHRIARRVPRHGPAVGRSSGSARDGVRDGHIARRERRDELRQPRQQFPEAGRGDAGAARGGARIAPDSRRNRRAHRRDLSPRAGACAARAGRPRDPGEPAARRAGAGRVLPRHHEARRDRDARQGPPSDPRRAPDAGAGRCRAPARPLPGEDRELREPRYARRRR